MSVLVDTSVLLSAIQPGDRRHSQAGEALRPVLAGEHGEPYITDYLVDEALTYLLNRGVSENQLARAMAFLLGDERTPSPFLLQPVGTEGFARALELVPRYREKRLSFTDCSTLAVMERLGVRTLASFDGGFDGLVHRIGGKA